MIKTILSQKAPCYSFIGELSLRKRNNYPIITEERMPYSIRNIKLQVYKYFQVKESEAERHIRKREIVEIRQIAMALCMDRDIKLGKWSLAKIGEEIGGYDHATVLHAVKAVDNHYNCEIDFRKKYDKLKDIIMYKFRIKSSQETPES